jgi:hypothetical protein
MADEQPQQPQDISEFAEAPQTNDTAAATANAVIVLENLVDGLRKHHNIRSKAEARGIIRQALLEI